MGVRIGIGACAMVLAAALVVRSETGTIAISRLRSTLFQVAPPLPEDEAMTPLPPPPEGFGREGGRLTPPGDQVLSDEVAEEGEAVPGGEGVDPGSAVTGSDPGNAGPPGSPEPQAGTEPVLPPPGPTPPPGATQGQPDERISQAEQMQARIEEMEGNLAEVQALQQEEIEAANERIADLEAELGGLNRRGQFLEENRAQRIDRLESGMSGIRYLEGVLAGGSTDVDSDLNMVAAELAGASTDASRYAGREEAEFSGRAQAAIQAAREAIARSDPYAARIYLGYALAQARAARAAAEAGNEPLFSE